MTKTFNDTEKLKLIIMKLINDSEITLENLNKERPSRIEKEDSWYFI